MSRHAMPDGKACNPHQGPARLLGALLMALLGFTASLAAQETGPQAIESWLGHWEGAIELPTGELLIRVDLSDESGTLAGTIDIPQQGAAGLRLTGFEVAGTSIRFAIEGIPGDPTFSGELGEDRMTGKFAQGGARFPFSLGREEVAPAPRPQEPKPPFPYDVEEVSYTNGDITLAGTLTLPRGSARSPAALLITGSGAQDRDESLLGHKPFLVIADRLTPAGIAVLRVDDRGVGGSTGNVAQSTTADFASDVLAGVEFLTGRERIDPAKIGVIGHSEGALVGPLAASQSPKIAFVVLLAGTGVPGGQVLTRQLEAMAEAEGVARETIARQLALQQELIDLLASDRSNEEIEAPFRALVVRQLDLQSELGGDSAQMSREQVIEQAVEQTLSPWFRFFVTYDPRPALSRVTVPVLALGGSLDTQVDAEQNLPEIRKALQKGGNEDVTIRLLPGLNHLFQHAKTGGFSEYARIEETFDEQTLEQIADWILRRFG